MKLINNSPTHAPLWASIAPILILLFSLICIIILKGATAVYDLSSYVLLGSSFIALILSYVTGSFTIRGIKCGMARSASQILPAVPMLIFIALTATTWMLSGVVPTLIYYGLEWLSPTMFLMTACGVCAIVSVLTGSSWSTIATIGVAFMGVGSVLGFSEGWIAGAIISGAYFGDKISPLSDTTVVASSACGVDLFKHIRYLMLTSMPAIIISLIVFGIVGFVNGEGEISSGNEIESALQTYFNITPLTLIIPALTLMLIALRVPTMITLAGASILGFAGIFIFQKNEHYELANALDALWSGSVSSTGNEVFDSLISTGGIIGMLPTIFLVLSAMIFGCVMIGTGMLSVVTNAFTKSLQNCRSIVGATVASGLFMNSCTADQYLSLIITGNMFRNVYRRCSLEPRLLSRTIEDSVSVTSVLIPWNSCGITQSTVLGVATLTYLPYCIFNILSPCMSLLLAYTGFKIKIRHTMVPYSR
ncbi:MAG: sodium:proton antiporter [Bacteroidales bacterium]|nr:sodium:proton antiporter [Bacteroidales bacterium]